MMMRRRSPSSPAAGPAARPARATSAVVAVLVGALSLGPAAHAAPSGLSLSGQWFRLVMPSLPAAGYFTLSNQTATPYTLVGAASSGCGMLMLHKSVSQNGEERMMMVPSVPVPAHGNIQFAPGSYHLMCMSPGPAMQPGHSVPVTLRFSDGEALNASFPVRGATGK
jgi:periplasmic copper chaperone A